MCGQYVESPPSPLAFLYQDNHYKSEVTHNSHVGLSQIQTAGIEPSTYVEIYEIVLIFQLKLHWDRKLIKAQKQMLGYIFLLFQPLLLLSVGFASLRPFHPFLYAFFSSPPLLPLCWPIVSSHLILNLSIITFRSTHISIVF